MTTLNEILAEFERVIADLRRTAPGLFGIHAAFDKVLADLRANTSAPANPVYTVTGEWTAPPATAPTIAPGVLVGMGAGGGDAVATSVTVTEPNDGADEPETTEEQ